MPANPKHLTTSKWKRFAKLSAGIVGGYFVATSLHLLVAVYSPNHIHVMVSGNYSIPIFWVACMIPPYWIKNPLKTWGIYVAIILVCVLMILPKI